MVCALRFLIWYSRYMMISFTKVFQLQFKNFDPKYFKFCSIMNDDFKKFFSKTNISFFLYLLRHGLFILPIKEHND